jgi:hypothetical protein
LPIPASADLVGSVVTVQEVLAVVGGPLLGVAELSNGAELTLGFDRESSSGAPALRARLPADPETPSPTPSRAGSRTSPTTLVRW